MRGSLAQLGLLIAAVFLSGPDVNYAWAEGSFRDAAILQRAIDEAAPFSTITLPKGLYRGHLVVAKPLRLIAEEGTILWAGESPEGSTLSIRADEVSLTGLAVRGSGVDAKAMDAGILLRGKGITLDSCSIEGALFGIRLERCADASVKDCRVRGDARAPFAKRGDGIRVTEGGDCLVEGCDVASVCDGVYLDDSLRTRILGSRLSDGRYGLHVMYGSSAILEGNTASSLVVGAMVMGTKYARLVRNVFLKGRDSRSSGLVLFESEGCLAQGNTIVGFTSGLVLDGAKSCSALGNTVSGNARGIVVEGASPGTIVASNAFEENSQSVAGAGDAASIRWTEGGRGNYWDDYKGYDLDGDGIGDAPYRRSRGFAVLAAKEPLLGVFFGSPLQRAVDGLDPDAEVLDTRPLIRH
jgi:nitrous oxidase accessory protein